MKKVLYTGLALVGAALSSVLPANAQPADNNQTIKDVSSENVVVQKAKNGFVFSDILKNNKNFSLAGHYSHSSHASHRSGW